MRLLVFLLVLANLVFFAWARGYLGGGEGDGARPPPLQAERIRIVSSDRPPEPTAERVADEAPPPAAPQQAPGDEAAAPEVCLAFVDVSPAEADAIERALAERLPEVRLVRAAPPGGASYWIHIPALKSRPDAEKKAAELRALGISDYFIMQEGNSENFAISLGLFSTPAAAEASFAALRARGVRSARLTERPRRPAISRAELRGPEALAAETRQTLAQTMPQARFEACARGAAAR
ncbi:MAG: SPOR domain-containing protein [Candidatus Accumulibacter sp.]|jgi:hypothetical protein|nr:SPOR domain-containing protein [Accumulibacter sp.]